jgi:hypothetical protein
MSKPHSATSKPSKPKSPAKGKPQPGSAATPVDAFDASDPGDSTQRNFRYQHAYGVILLVASTLGLRPYVAIWCEQHEDYLAERTDRTFDGYQIKTSRPENGAWKLNNFEFAKAIGRFAELVQEFGDAINGLFFVSNTECETVGKDNTNDRLRALCPRLFLELSNLAANQPRLTPSSILPFKNSRRIADARKMFCSARCARWTLFSARHAANLKLRYLTNI